MLAKMFNPMPAALEDSLLEKIALFYYFAFLDEGKAQAATARTIKFFLKINLAEKKSSQQAVLQNFVAISNRIVHRYKGEARAASFSFSAGHIVLPEKSNWGPWFEFRKAAEQSDFLAVLYAKVLQVDEATIAAGLGVPLGTVRHRLGRGLKTLGRICHSSGMEVGRA
jgi:hypothetical protein